MRAHIRWCYVIFYVLLLDLLVVASPNLSTSPITSLLLLLLLLLLSQKDKCKKWFSSDFMAKESAIWIDPFKKSLHWYVQYIHNVLVVNDVDVFVFILIMFIITRTHICRGKTKLDAVNSKYLLLEPYNKNAPVAPTSMRPAGELKGNFKSMDADEAGFKITLWSGKVFEASVRTCCIVFCSVEFFSIYFELLLIFLSCLANPWQRLWIKPSTG